MDAIEISRQTAERLHLEAVKRGCDPWRPYAFVLAEAVRRDLVVEKVPIGDVRLHGGRATFDPDALLILHEDVGNEFVHAFLVAHELGHVEFDGRGEADVTASADPIRPAEATAIGIDRVVDYGRRERREVQMDLFAREFILPRPVAQRLHVIDTMTASQIAERLVAPFDVVALQLLDGLLLPRVELTSAEPGAEKPLNAEQAKAAAHHGSPFLLEAGPGTGKTQTLVSRLGDLLARGVDASTILILTFSNKAAGELSERIAAKWPEAAAAAWIGTFHAFGLDIIRRFHDQLGLPPDPRLMDRTEAIELLEEEFPRLVLVHYRNLWDPSFELSDILSAISRANDEVVDAEHYAALAARMAAAATTVEAKAAAERCAEVAVVFKAYEQLKRDRTCLDFGDLASMPVRLCESNAEVREHLKNRYQHILVDEFQDVNRASIRLLQAIAGGGENLWVVGDAKQSIYRFRGASSFNVARFGVQDFPGGQRGRLVTNYRSTKEITDAFVAFARMDMKAAAGSADVALQAERGPSGVKPEYRAVQQADDEIGALAEAISEGRSAGFSYRDQALLCSGNERLGRIAAGLESLGIPVLYLGSLFERGEVKDLLSLLSLLTDRRAMGLVRIGVLPFTPLSLPDVVAALRHLGTSGAQPMDWASVIDEIGDVTSAGAASLRTLGGILAGFSPTSNPWDVLVRVLLDRTRIAAEIADASDVAMRARGIAIWQFLNFVRAQPRGVGLPAARLLDRIRRLVILSDERDLRQLPAAAQGIDAVRLMTIHGSKGLEFPVVHIPGLNDDALPRSPNMIRGCAPPDGLVEGASGSGLDVLKSGHVEEQECLFFVALSRARDRLLLYSPTKKSNGHNRAPSRFIDRLRSTIDRRSIAPKLAVPLAAEDMPVPIDINGAFALTSHQLGLYQRCPRRFLYTHLIEVGGRRTETAFMKMHAAVQHVVDWMTADIAATPGHAEIEARLTAVWDTHGPGDHGYAAEYKRIAVRLIAYFAETRAGFKRLPPEELRLIVAGGEITIRPDEVLVDGAGKTIMRRIRTGHGSSKDDDDVAAATFKIAAGNAAPGCVVELVHLSDEEIKPIEMSAKVLANRQVTAAGIVADIRAGQFPMKPSRTCPRCPAFFICGPVPSGALTKKIPPDLTGSPRWRRLILRSPLALCGGSTRTNFMDDIPPSHPIDVDDLETAIREGRHLHRARAYRIKVADETLNFRPIEVVDPMPLGRQILEAAGAQPIDEFSVFALLPHGDFEDVRLDEPFDLRGRGTEKFICLRTDRQFKFTIDNRQMEWGKPLISSLIVRRLAAVGPEYAIYLEVRGGQDREIQDQDIIDLSKPGIERFITVIRETTEGLTALPTMDRTYLEDHAIAYDLVSEGGQAGVILKNVLLPAGKFDHAQADLLILLPSGYPDACPDMFFTLPWLRLTEAGRYPTCADVPHMCGGNRWQRWSRHSGAWRPGVDGLHTMLTRARHAIEGAR